jgi:hypothetical protein
MNYEWAITSKQHTHLELPVSPLEARRVAFPVIRLSADSNSSQVLNNLLHALGDSRPLLVGRLGRYSCGYNDHLRVSHTRGDHEALVVAVDHHHHADRASRETPRVLPHEKLARLLVRRRRLLWVLDHNVEHLGEILPQAVTCTPLDPPTRRWHKALDCRGVVSASELFLLGLLSRDNRDSEKFLIHTTVEIKNLEHFFRSFLKSEMCGMAFLPVKFTCAEERF